MALMFPTGYQMVPPFMYIVYLTLHGSAFAPPRDWLDREIHRGMHHSILSNIFCSICSQLTLDASNRKLQSTFNTCQVLKVVSVFY